MVEHFNTVRILGISFYNDSFERALEIAHQDGGLFLAPSGPGLADLGQNPHYDSALAAAEVNLIDSGYLALLWQKRTGDTIQRHSGLKFIKALLEDPRFQKNTRQLWVMPSEEHVEITKKYLNASGIDVASSNFYAAPHYRESPVRDDVLLERIRVTQPDYVILAIAGGKQEVLGHWLRDELDHQPAIICIGAAIAFLSGQQANIPPWADRIYIGWLLRILTDPKTFIPRYWKARKLRHLLEKHGEHLPG
jgi:UDP-N-acetyl-D-mannosaminuronic acid transferase (WecB/TagA/CpsF family)